MFNKCLASYDTCFFKTIHTFSNFHVYPSILSNIVDWLFCLDFISEVFDGYSHIPVGGHGIVKVEFSDVRSAAFGSSFSVRDDTIEHYFGVEE